MSLRAPLRGLRIAANKSRFLFPPIEVLSMSTATVPATDKFQSRDEIVSFIEQQTQSAMEKATSSGRRRGAGAAAAVNAVLLRRTQRAIRASDAGRSW